jgi:hypothetical protein
MVVAHRAPNQGMEPLPSSGRCAAVSGRGSCPRSAALAGTGSAPPAEACSKVVLQH